MTDDDPFPPGFRLPPELPPDGQAGHADQADLDDPFPVPGRARPARPAGPAHPSPRRGRRKHTPLALLVASTAAIAFVGGTVFGVQQVVEDRFPAEDGIRLSSVPGDATPQAGRTPAATGTPAAPARTAGPTSKPGGGLFEASAKPGRGTAKLGVFRGTDVGEVDDFGDWLGADADYVLDYSARDTWSEIADPGYMLREWRNEGYRTVYAVPMLPTKVSSATVQQGATGEYDRYFRQLARNLVAYGQEDAILRVGWEFNTSGSRWRIDDAEAWKAYFRRIVRAMRSADGQEFQFDWNVNATSTAVDAPRFYPGDDVVDYVGVDSYDVGWAAGTYPYPADCDDACRLTHQKAAWDEIYGNARGLKFWADFAREQGKPMSLPEWGLWQRADRHGGGDNAYFIRQMHAFIADPRNHVAYQAYFDTELDDGDTHALADFPEAGPEFRRLFR